MEQLPTPEQTSFQKEVLSLPVEKGGVVPRQGISAPIAFFQEEKDSAMSVITSPGGSPVDLPGGKRCIDVLVEIWNVRSSLWQRLRHYFNDKNLPLVPNQHHERIAHNLQYFHAKLVWAQHALPEKSFEKSEWVENGTHLLNSHVMLLSEELPQEYFFDDPLWENYYGTKIPEKDRNRKFQYSIEKETVVKNNPGGEQQFSENLKVQKVEEKWDQLCEIIGRRPYQYLPVEFGIADRKKWGGVVSHETVGYHLQKDIQGNTRLGSARGTQPKPVIRLNDSEKMQQENYLVSHELTHILTPFHPTNEVFTEGLAQLITGLQKERYGHESWDAVPTPGSVWNGLKGPHRGYNLGDSVFTSTMEEFSSIHGKIAGQALWEILEKDISQLRMLVRLTQSPSIDCSSTAKFLKEVDRFIPGFEERFLAHPTMQPMQSGPRVVIYPISKGFVVSSFIFKANTSAAKQMQPLRKKAHYDYIWKKDQKKCFDSNSGTVSHLPLKMIFTSELGRTTSFGTQNPGISQVLTGGIAIGVCKHAGWPDAEIYGKKIQVNFLMELGSEWIPVPQTVGIILGQ